MFQLFSILLILSAANASPIYSFMHHHIAYGIYDKPDVPREIRGKNFTKANLEKYFDQVNYNDVNKPVDYIITTIPADELVAVGKEVWKFVEDNKPVVNINTDYTGAVPKNVSNWRQLSGWKNTEKGPYKISWINGFNTETVSINFKWSDSYGGSFNNKGKYVTQAGPVIGSIHVAWGYTVNVDVKAFNPINIGSEENPIGQIDVELTSRISTILRDSINNCRVRFLGDGRIRNVHCNLY